LLLSMSSFLRHQSSPPPSSPSSQSHTSLSERSVPIVPPPTPWGWKSICPEEQSSTFQELMETVLLISELLPLEDTTHHLESTPPHFITICKWGKMAGPWSRSCVPPHHHHMEPLPEMSPTLCSSLSWPVIVPPIWFHVLMATYGVWLAQQGDSLMGGF
jgi:hypothetical protein